MSLSNGFCGKKPVSCKFVAINDKNRDKLKRMFWKTFGTVSPSQASTEMEQKHRKNLSNDQSWCVRLPYRLLIDEDLCFSGPSAQRWKTRIASREKIYNSNKTHAKCYVLVREEVRALSWRKSQTLQHQANANPSLLGSFSWHFQFEFSCRSHHQKWEKYFHTTSTRPTLTPTNAIFTNDRQQRERKKKRKKSRSLDQVSPPLANEIAIKPDGQLPQKRRGTITHTVTDTSAQNPWKNFIFRRHLSQSHSLLLNPSSSFFAKTWTNTSFPRSKSTPDCVFAFYMHKWAVSNLHRASPRIGKPHSRMAFLPTFSPTARLLLLPTPSRRRHH